jgi:hypothetical protein
MSNIVRAVFPMLIVLRLADQKEPVMDKLFFYVRRMDLTLEKSKGILDEMEKRTRGASWRSLSDIRNHFDPNIDEADFVDDDEEMDESTDSESLADDGTKSLGEKVVEIWLKRRDRLVTDFAIAGWLLSPIPEVYRDSSSNQTGEHRDAVDRLLKKMMGSEFAEDSDELAAIMNTFWEEFEQFKSKSGVFSRAYIWSETTNSDLSSGKSHVWHKKNSFFQTKILGRFACRVCSKIVGMGSAERNWGDVKHLKSEKRSHLSASATEKQATIFGVSCMRDAQIEREKLQSNGMEPYKFWDEDDFDREFDMLSGNGTSSSTKRILKCYFEPWEQEHIVKKDNVSKAKFLQKYGGLEFNDIDHPEVHLRICDKEMKFRRRLKTDLGGWTAVTYNLNNETDTWRIEPGCPLHDCLATYYHKHPEKNVKVVLRKEQKDDFDWLIAQQTKTNGDGGSSVSDTVTSNESVSRSGRKSKAHKSTKNSPKKTSTTHRPETGNESDGMGPCGGCGNSVGPVHKCDICKRNMHPFCGRTIGQEGYGSTVRCPECDRAAK